MQGVIFDELEKNALSVVGQVGMVGIRDQTGRADGYRLDATYPDDEVVAIVQCLVEATGRPLEQIVEEFGAAAVPGLLDVYGFLVNPRWSFMDFLLNTESVIHRGVKLHTPYAQPPALQVERAGPGSVAITYRSERRLCGLAKGIIRGAASHYGVEITISEDRCMLRGDPACLITVSGEE